jgi:hypothetical protein
MLLIGIIELVLASSATEGAFTRTAIKRSADMMVAEAPTVQIYGDSVADGALNEKVIAKKLGVSSSKFVNYSVPGSTAICAYPLLKRQIEAGRTPQVIILAYSARSYAVPLSEKFFGRFATWGELFEASEYGLTAGDVIKAILCRSSFSLRYREELNGIVRSGGHGLDYFSEKKRPAVGLAERRSSLSDVAPTPIDSSVAGGTKIFNPTFANVAFTPPSISSQSMERFLELAKKHQIKVFLISVPKPQEAHALHDRNGFNSNYAAFLSNLRDQHGVRLVLAEAPVWDLSEFSDSVHLGPQAAWKFSELVAEKLQPLITDQGPSEVSISP